MFRGLHTSTNDYIELLSTKEVYGNSENAHEIFLLYGNDWGEYEKSLGDIDLELIEEILSYPDCSSDCESDRDGVI